MTEKIITEVLSINLNPDEKHLMQYPEIDRHLSEGWRVKQMFHQPIFERQGIGPSYITLTVHLEL
jgi:hypothetical protein